MFAWLTLASLLLCFLVVVQRYAFATTHLWMQDLYVWLNGAMFMAVAGYTLLIDGHVRVDILYRPASRARQGDAATWSACWCSCCRSARWSRSGACPTCSASWGLREGVRESGGMPGLFILKGFILVFVALVGTAGPGDAGAQRAGAGGP